MFVNAVMEGKSRHQAAVAAGYPNSTGFDRSTAVKEEIARARAEVSDLTTLKRLDVIEGIMDGVQIARLQADAGNVIKGWTEIAKILGHYAPEVKQVNLTIGQERLLHKFQALSTEDLLAIAEGAVIDGEAAEIH